MCRWHIRAQVAPSPPPTNMLLIQCVVRHVPVRCSILNLAELLPGYWVPLAVLLPEDYPAAVAVLE
eukprot:1437514-Rhodomonas_salina.1